MKFFADTANLDAIKKLAAYGILDGVTTNPTLIAKEGADLETRIKEICQITTGPVSAEVTTEIASEMIKQGKKLATIAPNVHVKLPMTEDGIIACYELTRLGIKTNVTLIFSANQALLAAKAGATLVSPFIGRLDDISHDGMALIEEISQIYANYDFQTEILVASIRHPRHVTEAAMLGADVATMPADVMEKMFKHPLTDLGVAKFREDYSGLKK